jgi:exonuclease III
MTFLTYNILDGGRGREQALQEIILAQHADVILLQEVAEPPFVTELAQRGGYAHYIAESNSWRTIALLTRLQIRSMQTFRPRNLRHTCLHAELTDANGNPLSIYGIHLCAPAFTLPLEVYRLWELNSILKFVNQTATDRIIIAGDLNSIAPGDKPDFSNLPFPLRLSILLHGGYIARQVVEYLRMRGYTDAFRSINPTANGYTLPAQQPNTRLDYVFLNDRLKSALRVCNVVTQPSQVNQASDHLPVWMELE